MDRSACACVRVCVLPVSLASWLVVCVGDRASLFVSPCVHTGGAGLTLHRRRNGRKLRGARVHPACGAVVWISWSS
eukprot:2622546-Prorocentrum_lima.AAC.1